jgi:hypothetical protein
LTTETALPSATPAAASEANTADALQQAQTDLAAAEGAEAKSEGETTPEGEQPPKKEKTAEEREIARLRRRVDNLTRRLYQGGERQPAVTNQPQPAGTNAPQQQTDDEPLTLSRKELEALVDQRARQVAPTIRQQQAEIEHRQGVVQKLAKEFGERFDEVAEDLDGAVGGLVDRQGRPTVAGLAIFEAEDPRALIEYLTDPDNAEDAEALRQMNPVKAGRKVAQIEAKLAAKKAEAKPQPSKAAAPLEPVRGSGKINAVPDPADTKAWIKWANEQEKAGNR